MKTYRSRGSALFVAVIVIVLAASAILYAKQRNDMQNEAAVYSAISTNTTKSGSEVSVIITNAESARSTASSIRGGNMTGTVSSAITVTNELVAKNLDQLAADFSGTTVTTSLNTATSKITTTSVSPQPWPTYVEVIVYFNGLEVTGMTISTPACLRTYEIASLKTQYVISTALQNEIKHGGICILVATAQSIIRSLNLPVLEWSKDGGNTISPEFLDKVHQGSMSTDGANTPGMNIADAQKMHENFSHPTKKFVCQQFIDPSDPGVGATNLCSYLNKAAAVPGHNCMLTVGNSTERKGHAMDIVSAEMGKDGKCNITTRSANADQQGDDKGSGVPSPNMAKIQKWSIPSSGNASLIGGNPEPSQRAKNEVAGLNYDVAEIQCCFVRNK